MQHAAFGVHLVEFHLAGLGYAQTVPEDQEQQATVAGFVPAALHGFNQLFNLAANEVLPLAVVTDRRLVLPAFARSSFCREFFRSDAPETRMNRAGDFPALYKMILFVESCEDLLLMPHSFESITGSSCAAQVCSKWPKDSSSLPAPFLNASLRGVFPLNYPRARFKARCLLRSPHLS
jgi:hypothetical protein